MNKILESMDNSPIIAAIRTRKEAEMAAKSNSEIIFLLGGDIPEVAKIVEILKNAEKKVFVHLDLIDGLGKDDKAVKFLAEYVNPNGIITTKSALIKTIKSCGILAGQRCFILDSKSYEVAVKSVLTNKPDLVELMPATIPRIIARFCDKVKGNIIAGGLVETKMDAYNALDAGALGVSTSKKELWNS